MKLQTVIPKAFMAFPTKVPFSNMGICLRVRDVYLEYTVCHLIYILPLTICYFDFSDCNNNSQRISKKARVLTGYLFFS